MDFEGKICGVCNKGRLHAFKEEIEKGVYVDAYKCDQDGHVSYSEEVERKVESIHCAGLQERHLVRVGPSSIAAPIPASIVKLFKLKPKEKIFIGARNRQIIIRPSPT